MDGQAQFSEDQNISAFAFRLAKIIEVEVDNRQKVNILLQGKILNYSNMLKQRAADQYISPEMEYKFFNEYFDIVEARQGKI